MLRDFVLQMAVNTLALTALHAARPMVTYRALDLGASPFEIGLVQAAFSLLPVFTAVAIGRWIDRLGAGRFLFAASALMSIASVILSFAGSLVGLAFAQVIFGFGQVINVVAGQAMIANRAPRDRRDQHYSWYATIVSTGQLLGPALAGLLAGSALAGAVAGIGPFTDNGQAAVFLFAALIAGIATVLSTLLLERGRRPPSADATASEPANVASAAWVVLRKPGMAAAMLVSLTVLSSIDVLVAYLPAYGEVAGLSVQAVGLLLAVRAGASLLSRLVMPQLIDRLGRQRLLTLSTGMAAAGILAVPFVSAVPVLVGLMIVAGLGLGIGQPMTIAWVANQSARRERALALGVRVTGNRLALLTVPAGIGALAGASGLATIWVAVAIFLGAATIVAARTSLDRGRPESAVPGGAKAEPAAVAEP